MRVSRKNYFSLTTFLNTWNLVLCARITYPQNNFFLLKKWNSLGCQLVAQHWVSNALYSSTLLISFSWKSLYPSFLQLTPTLGNLLQQPHTHSEFDSIPQSFHASKTPCMPQSQHLAHLIVMVGFPFCPQIRFELLDRRMSYKTQSPSAQHSA